MRIYIGRWSLLPANWEGYNGLIEKSEEEIASECNRQLDESMEKEGMEDKFIASYTPAEFEDTFNQCLDESFSTDVYWIRIF